MDDLIEALTIFRKYLNEDSPTHCEHDRFMVVGLDEDSLSEDDAKRIVELSFFWSDGYDCWISYRFGSA